MWPNHSALKLAAAGSCSATSPAACFCNCTTAGVASATKRARGALAFYDPDIGSGRSMNCRPVFFADRVRLFEWR